MYNIFLLIFFNHVDVYKCKNQNCLCIEQKSEGVPNPQGPCKNARYNARIISNRRKEANGCERERSRIICW